MSVGPGHGRTPRRQGHGAGSGAARSSARLVRTRVSVDVPATSANLGAGFDALALALDLSNVVTVEARPGGPPGELAMDVEGEGANRLRADRRNRLCAGLERGLRELGMDLRVASWHITMRNSIPLSRGLGSSASATIAGLVAADALAGGGLSSSRMLTLALEAEGHPDNAAAALLGGFVIVSHGSDGPCVVRLDPPPALLTVLFVPDRHLSTAAMRSALPASVPFRDAVHNVAASSLAVAAMATGRLELLRDATEDRLHEPYRAAAHPELPRLIAAARSAGALGACLSGAGSSVIAFADDARLAERVAAALAAEADVLRIPGRSLVVRTRREGATITD